MSEEIKELLIDLQQYIDEPNNQDINGEYEPPRELEQGEARLLLDLINNLQNQLQEKENIIEEAIEYIEEHSYDYRVGGIAKVNGKKLLEILRGEDNDW